MPKCRGILIDSTRNIIRIKLESSILSVYIELSSFESCRQIIRFVTAKNVIHFGLIHDRKVISCHFGFSITLTSTGISPIAVVQATDLYRLLACFKLFVGACSDSCINSFHQRRLKTQEGFLTFCLLKE
jgi:hypothetical protein